MLLFSVTMLCVCLLVYIILPCLSGLCRLAYIRYWIVTSIAHKRRPRAYVHVHVYIIYIILHVNVCIQLYMYMQ